MKNCHECGEEMYDDDYQEDSSCERCIEETIEGNDALRQHAIKVAEWERLHPKPDYWGYTYAKQELRKLNLTPEQYDEQIKILADRFHI